MMKRTTALLLLCLGVGGPFAGLLGPWHWFFDLSNHYYYQWMCLGALCFILLMIMKSFKSSGFVFVVCLWSFFKVFPFLPIEFEASAIEGEETTISILHANLYTHNPDHETIVTVIERENPDVLVFLEVGKQWAGALEESLQDYQEIQSIIREDHFGIAVYSKLPARLIAIEYLGKAKVPSLHIQLYLDRREVTLWATHPYPPVSERNWHLRNEQLTILNQRVQDSLRPTILVGDLNTAPWTSAYAKTVGSELIHSAEGKGIYGSWRADWPSWLRIPIDHILHTRHFRSTEFKVLDDVGSDHVPILAELQLVH